MCKLPTHALETTLCFILLMKIMYVEGIPELSKQNVSEVLIFGEIMTKYSQMRSVL